MCIGCQKDGTGGGSLCIGEHGKRKGNCKLCHPDEYAAELKRNKAQYAKRRDEGKINCTVHKTGTAKKYCMECQEDGTGVGSLCIEHGKRKYDCKLCNPEKYATNSLKMKEKRAVDKASGKRDFSSGTTDGITTSLYTDESYWDELKCVCEKNLEDPICAVCASMLENIFDEIKRR